MSEKILKIKVGEIYMNGENIPVFNTAYRKTSKKGIVYYETKNPIFIQEIRSSEKVN